MARLCSSPLRSSWTRILGLIAIAALCVPLEALAKGGNHYTTGSVHSSTGFHKSTPKPPSVSQPTRSSTSTKSGHSTTSHKFSSTTHWGTDHHEKAIGVERDTHGRIKRSSSAKMAFKHSHPCPSTGKSSGACPGYVVDHVQSLKHGG